MDTGLCRGVTLRHFGESGFFEIAFRESGFQAE